MGGAGGAGTMGGAGGAAAMGGAGTTGGAGTNGGAGGNANQGGTAGRGVGGVGGATSGNAGSGGAGGQAGSAGAAGAGGSAMPLCSANPTQLVLTDFSPATLTANGTWGTPGQLTGDVFGFGGAVTDDAGVRSSVTAIVDRTNRDLALSGTVLPNDYAGGGMSFDSCVDTTSWTGIQFTLGGTSDGCSVTFQLQTASQEPVSNHGTCQSTCYDFPNVGVTIPTTAGTPTVVRFSDLADTGMPSAASDIEMEMFGLEWQFITPAPTDGGVARGCSPDMTITDVRWVSN
jgi:hypothetical protein